MKKRIIILMVLAMLIVVPFTNVAFANKILRLGHEMPENHPYHLGSVIFADLVKEKTNGEIEIKIYPHGTIGKQKEMAQSVSMGRLDFCLTWQGILEAYDKNVGAITMPYEYRNWNHVWKVLDGPIGEEVLKGVEKKGIKVLTNFNNGLYSFVSAVEITSPESIKGIKLRVQPSAVFIETGEILNTVVTPLAFGEVYNALQLGTVDAEIQGPINVRKSKHYEVAKYTCETNMYYLLEPLMMSMGTWNGLTESQQKIIKEAAVEAAKEQRKMAEEAHFTDREYLVSQGMKYYQPDRAEWEDALKPMYDNHPEWADIIKRIKETK